MPISPRTQRQLSQRVQELELEVARLRSGRPDSDFPLFAAVVDALDEPFYVKDLAGRYVYVNDAAARSVGLTREVITGSTDREVFAAIEADAIVEHDGRVLASGVAETIPERISTAEGEKTFLSTKSPLRDGAGAVVGLVGVSRDVTALSRETESRQRAESMLSLVTDALPILIAYVDADRRYQFVNRAYEQRWGLSREAILGRTVRSLLGDEVYERARPFMDRVLQGEAVRYEIDLPGRDGATRNAEVSYVPHLPPAGRPVLGFFALIYDVTDRQQVELAQQRHREVLEKTARQVALGAVAGSLAHELRQPLSAIMSNAQAAQRLLARKPPALEEVGAALADIVRDSRRGDDVIRGLRGLVSRDRRERARTDLHELLEGTLRLVRGEAKARGVVLDFRPGSKVPPVAVERVQIEQLVVNLLMNGLQAMEATPPGRRTLLVRTRNSAEHTVTVSVRDNGRGAADDILPRLFDPFFTPGRKAWGSASGSAAPSPKLTGARSGRHEIGAAV